MGKQGIKNGEVYEIAENENSWIITRDADFQNLRKFHSYNIAGIILFKLMRSKTEHLLNAMVRLLDKQKDKFAGKTSLLSKTTKSRFMKGK
jgi:predicted nuclease of predicted toxin-antitoxin system